jgi:hypothetical protein
MGIGHEIDRVRVGVVTTSSPKVLASAASAISSTRVHGRPISSRSDFRRFLSCRKNGIKLVGANSWTEPM